MNIDLLKEFGGDGRYSELDPRHEPVRIANETEIAARMGWKYYIPAAEQNADVLVEHYKLANKHYNIVSLKLIDPCMGSGHILVYAFDVFMQIYRTLGWSERDAAQSILENNLFGLDIDDRAAQLAYFAVMMKARQYDRRILARGIQPKVYGPGNDPEVQEYGSLLLVDKAPEAPQDGQLSLMDASDAYKRLLAQKYDVVVTNPPYMGASNMHAKLNQFIKDNYADYKSDFFSAFIVRITQMAKQNGYCGFFTPYVWMFIQSYEKLRHLLCQHKTIETLIQFEYSAFEEATVPVCTFVFKNSYINKKGCYFRLTDFRGGMEVQRQKTLEAIADHDCGYYYEASSDNFSKIPGSPIAYWVSGNFIEAFKKGKPIGSFSRISEGIKTGDNNNFLRLWPEVSSEKFSFAHSTCGFKWYPHHKGGEYRKWYGNLEYVINWEDNGKEIRSSSNSGLQGKELYFNEFAGWSKISSKGNPLRYYQKNILFDSGAPALSNNKIKFCIGLFNSKVGSYYLQVLSPTLNLQVGDAKSMPVLFDNRVDDSIDKCISISKTDWDSFETSWDFEMHPIVQKALSRFHWGHEGAITLEYVYRYVAQDFEQRFQTLKANEEELNRIFIDIYGLQDELTPEVEDKDVTVRRADLGRDIRSMISYAVGCMFGRYSLDKPGLVYAGGDWDEVYRKGHLTDESGSTISFGGFSLSIEKEYTYVKTGDDWTELVFYPDKDNIIPICDDEYFDDDITGRFVKWVEVVFGKETLEENLKYIADALGGKGTPREVIRSYFLNDFYADHLKTYQKRPIYWLFDSGRKNGFKALIYMHRYQSDLLARLRTDYVHEQQERYRTQLKHIGDAMDSASASERVKLAKQQKKLQDQALELAAYEEKVHHLADRNIKIDLDDGVKHNYALFEDVLAKIK